MTAFAIFKKTIHRGFFLKKNNNLAFANIMVGRLKETRLINQVI